MKRPSSGTQCNETPVSHSPACLHLFRALSLVFIKFTPPALSVHNESWLFHRRDNDKEQFGVCC